MILRNRNQAKIRSLHVSFKNERSESGLSQYTLENKLCLPGRNRIDIISMNEIALCIASSNYAEIITVDGRKLVISKTLSWLEEKIRGNNFLRVHQSYLIRIDLVTCVEKVNGYQLKLKGIEKAIPVSRSNQKLVNDVFCE